MPLTLEQAVQAVIDTYGTYKSAKAVVDTDNSNLAAAQHQLGVDQPVLDSATTSLDNAIVALQSVAPPPPPAPPVPPAPAPAPVVG